MFYAKYFFLLYLKVTSELYKSSIEPKNAKVVEDDRIVQSQPVPNGHMSTRNRNTSSYRSVGSSVNSKVTQKQSEWPC